MKLTKSQRDFGNLAEVYVYTLYPCECKLGIGIALHFKENAKQKWIY